MLEKQLKLNSSIRTKKGRLKVFLFLLLICLFDLFCDLPYKKGATCIVGLS